MSELKTIAIIGLGYVDLPLTVEFGKRRPVIGFDINQSRIRHVPGSLDHFVAQAVANLSPGDNIQATMEPTGMSWFPVAHRLTDCSVSAARVKGKRVKALRRYLSEHAKTDLADAHAYVLAAVSGFGGPRLDTVRIPAPKNHALQRLTKQRRRFHNAIAASKRRLLDLVRWASPVLEQILPVS